MAQTQEESERTMARLISSAGMPASVSELCEIVITAPDPDWPCAFARSLVEDRLAASAHNHAPGSGRSADGRARCMSGPKAGYRCTPAGTGPPPSSPGQERASLPGARCACPADHRRQPRLPRLDREGDQHSQHRHARADHMTQAAHRRHDNRAGRDRNRQDLRAGVSYGLLMASFISGKLVPV